jgi:hypothetical protein
MVPIVAVTVHTSPHLSYDEVALHRTLSTPKVPDLLKFLIDRSLCAVEENVQHVINGTSFTIMYNLFQSNQISQSLVADMYSLRFWN